MVAVKKIKSGGCPFSGSLSVGNCPAFKNGCLFSNAGANFGVRDDINSILNTMVPASHFPIFDENNPADEKLPAAIQAVETLKLNLGKFSSKPKYSTKLTSGELMIDRVDHLSLSRDLRLHKTPPQLGNDSRSVTVYYASDVINQSLDEKQCLGYLVATYRIYSSLEDAWHSTGEGRVRGLCFSELARKRLMRIELCTYFGIESSQFNEYIDEHYPTSSVISDCVKRINHLLVVNPLLLVPYMYLMYAGTLFARDFRRGLRHCAPSISKAWAFRDLNNCWKRALEYQKELDEIRFGQDEADEIVAELKYVYKMQVAFFHELDRSNKRDKDSTMQPGNENETSINVADDTPTERVSASITSTKIELVSRMSSLGNCGVSALVTIFIAMLALLAHNLQVADSLVRVLV